GAEDLLRIPAGGDAGACHDLGDALAPVAVGQDLALGRAPRRSPRRGIPRLLAAGAGLAHQGPVALFAARGPAGRPISETFAGGTFADRTLAGGTLASITLASRALARPAFSGRALAAGAARAAMDLRLFVHVAVIRELR